MTDAQEAAIRRLTEISRPVYSATRPALDGALRRMDMHKTTIHRDGTVTVWDVYRQCWYRAYARVIADSEELMSSVGQRDRERIERAAQIQIAEQH